MSGRSVFVYHPSLEGYCFSPSHPFGPVRLNASVSLMKALGLLSPKDMIKPRPASFEELSMAHDLEYIRMVEQLSQGCRRPEDGFSFGLGTEDNPVFPGMHEAASLVVGASLNALEEVMEGRADHAVNISGGLNEQGKGAGHGYCVNIPLEAFTEDESFISCLNEVLPDLMELFQPDLIVSQNGCDAHVWDPLTHLALTMESFSVIPKIAHELAHAFTGGKWVKVGGGGYDPFRVVPRAWTLLWAEAAGLKIKDDRLPKDWLDRWQGISTHPLPCTLMDPPDIFSPIARRAEITEKNMITARKAVQDAAIRLQKFNKFL